MPEESENFAPKERFEDIILDISWKDYESCLLSKRHLDSKAGTLLAATGVLFGLIVNGLKNMNSLLAFITLGVLLGVAYFGVSALKLRTYSMIDSREVLDSLCQFHDNPKKVKLDLYATLSSFTDKNVEKVEEVAKYLRWAFNLFFLALVFIGLALIVPIIVRTG